MNRLESIKERFNTYDFVHSYIDHNSCNDEWEAHKAIEYLLQRLERYENCLKEIRRITPYGMYHEMIDKALEENETHT